MKALRVLEQIDRVEGAIERWFILVVGTVVILLFLAQVLTRYVLHVSIGWYQEILSFTYIWSMLMAMSYLFRIDKHINYGAFVDNMKWERTKASILLLAPVLTLVFSIFVLWTGVAAVSTRYASGMESTFLKMPLFIEGLILPIFGFLVFCGAVLSLVKLATSASKVFGKYSGKAGYIICRCTWNR